MIKESIRYTIYCYKFYNTPLEKVILELLKVAGINQYTFRHESNQDLFFKLADQLTSYKFNKTDMNSEGFTTYILFWLEDHKDKFKTGYF